MTSRNSTAPQAQSPSQAIRTVLQGMENVSAMLITVGRSLTDDAAEQQATLATIDQVLTQTHEDCMAQSANA